MMKHFFSGKIPAGLLFILTFLLSAVSYSQNRTSGDTAAKKSKPDSLPLLTSAERTKAYSRLVRKETVSDTGMFIVHYTDNAYYFEIPDSLYDRDMLLSSARSAMSSSDIDEMVAGERVNPGIMVRWERSPGSDKVLLRKSTSRTRLRFTGEDAGFQKSLALQVLDPVIVSFPVKAEAPGGNLLIDIKPLYVADIPDLTPFRGSLIEMLKLVAPRKYAFKEDRSYITEVLSFQQNIEVRSLLTFTEGDNNIYTLLMHRSLILLPKTPMAMRYADPRVGYFGSSFEAFDETSPVSPRHFISRWRLEPFPEDREKMKRGELVEPQKPVVFYIDETTPAKWKPYIKKGIEDWNAAFEEAGFKNAVQVRDAPVNDPDFHPEDIRYSVIRYAASEVSNARGPAVTDPRSGEILESDILVFHNVLKLLDTWLFTQTAACDPAVRTLHISDDILGDALRYVVRHEVGHSLGLRHNMIASSAFPVDSLRSATFTQKYGTSPSVMDYARFNYVAQPQDKGVRLTPPVLGVYDKYAIAWGYKPVFTANSPQEEKPVLDKWIEAHAGDPKYAFGEGDINSSNPDVIRERLGDDAVKASRYGVNNIKILMKNLSAWLGEKGSDYDDLELYYTAILRQYERYFNHVGSLIGGIYSNRPVQGESTPMYAYPDHKKQHEAVQFILQQFRELPAMITAFSEKNNVNLIERRGEMRSIITPSSYIEGLMGKVFQQEILNVGKLIFLIESGLADGKNGYGPEDLFRDLRADIFKETTEGKPVDHYRQWLQSVYVDRLISSGGLKPVYGNTGSLTGREAVSADPWLPAIGTGGGVFNAAGSFYAADLLNAVAGSSGAGEGCFSMSDMELPSLRPVAAPRAAFSDDPDQQLYFQTMKQLAADKAYTRESLTRAELSRIRALAEKGMTIKDNASKEHYANLSRKISLYIGK